MRDSQPGPSTGSHQPSEDGLSSATWPFTRTCRLWGHGPASKMFWSGGRPRLWSSGSTSASPTDVTAWQPRRGAPPTDPAALGLSTGMAQAPGYPLGPGNSPYVVLYQLISQMPAHSEPVRTGPGRPALAHHQVIKCSTCSHRAWGRAKALTSGVTGQGRPSRHASRLPMLPIPGLHTCSGRWASGAGSASRMPRTLWISGCFSVQGGHLLSGCRVRVSTEQSWASQNADAAAASLTALGSYPLLAQHSLPATQERLCRKGRRGGLGPPPKVTVRRITHGLESQWGVGGRKHGLRQLILFLRDLALCRKCEDSLLPRFPSNSHPESIPVKEEHVL